jgi:hypothetical protein
MVHEHVPGEDDYDGDDYHEAVTEVVMDAVFQLMDEVVRRHTPRANSGMSGET